MTLALAIMSMGCAAKRPVRAHVEVPRECITAVELTEKTECQGVSGESLHCTGLLLTKRTGCEVLNVTHEEEKK